MEEKPEIQEPKPNVQGQEPSKTCTRTKILRVGVLIAVIALTALLFIYRKQLQGLQEYGYIGIFLLSIAANATLIVPVPGVALAAAWGSVFNPWWVAFAAGSGAALGELTGYAAGFSGQGVVEYKGFYLKLLSWMKAHPRWTFWLLVLLAFIPNPLMDVAGMAAGVLKIPVWKFLIACIIGKIGKMLVFSFLGHYSIKLLG